MFVKCAVICFLSLLLINFIEALDSRQQACSIPYIEHGRIRTRNRAKIIRFNCYHGYELAGNRYSTCINGMWEMPTPVCVKQGCQELPPVENGVQLKHHKDAWLVTYCMPGYKLEGSAVIYCDGVNWNGTAPRCIASENEQDPSCDFEDDLCGWTQDELHDTDWKRRNKKTPSFYLSTGPSYDHTLGEGKNGHYMYFESTGLRINDTARLISPVIDYKMAVNACFSFFYHMYGRNMGGLRVYQMPDQRLQALLQLSVEDRKPYILFEQWGNLGDNWIGAAPKLDYRVQDFQIVIEGVQGKSFANDIAFDDVAILHGENCTKFNNSLVTFSLPSLSCQGRCVEDDETVPSGDCSCSPSCIMSLDCCEDYLDVCTWGSDADNVTESVASTSTNPPQTERLILSSTTTTSKPPVVTTTSVTTTRKTTKQPTKQTATPTTTKLTTITPDATTKRATTSKPIPITTEKMTIAQKVTAVKLTTTIKRTTVVPVKSIVDYRKINMEKEKTEEQLEIQRIPEVHDVNKKSSALRTTVITVVVLAVAAALVYGAMMFTTARGWVSVARLRARVSNDAEVRYLTTNDDDL